MLSLRLPVVIGAAAKPQRGCVIKPRVGAYSAYPGSGSAGWHQPQPGLRPLVLGALGTLLAPALATGRNPVGVVHLRPGYPGLSLWSGLEDAAPLGLGRRRSHDTEQPGRHLPLLPLASASSDIVTGLWFVHHPGMAFRIHDSVVRGEVDNRVKGIVRGKIWLEGRAEPVVLELKGNAWPDLAGCRLTFTNPQKRIPHPHLDSLHPVQRGSIGDLTASRKVRVFDVPLEEALERIRRKEKPPEHLANSLYLEWFSEANGRVVIESADYALTISAPEWRMTPEEEAERAKQAAAGMTDFMGKLTEAIEQHRRGQKDPEAEWNEHDYEKLLKESDARTNKYLEHVFKSQAGLEAVAMKKLLPEGMIAEARKELFEIREGILRLMDEFRGRSRA